MRPHAVVLVILALGIGAGSALAQDEASLLQRQVADTERAFAQTMADRDHAAFTALLSEEAVFFGSSGVLRGKEEVAEGWRALFDGPEGERIGTFNSVWRLHADGGWRVVFDKGCPPCRASWVRPATKSYDHTWCRYEDLRRMRERYLGLLECRSERLFQ